MEHCLFFCRDELLAAIVELVSKLNQWLEVQGHIKVAKESLQDCHQQMALVKEAEAHGPSAQHPLYTLSTRYAKHRRARDAIEKACVALREKIEDCEKHLNLHKVTESSLLQNICLHKILKFNPTFILSCPNLYGLNLHFYPHISQK